MNRPSERLKWAGRIASVFLFLVILVTFMLLVQQQP